jgi:ornithine carbamoyltransferase
VSPRHFLDIDGIETATLRYILDLGKAYKAQAASAPHAPLAGRMMAMIFEKPSTRTRVSFEVGMRQLGGDVVVLTERDTQLGRGESIADTARVLSRYVDAIMIRTFQHAKLTELASYATVPVINGLTDASHPCQVLADVMTFEECHGPLAGRVVAWSGDGNNVVTSWIHAAPHFGFELRIACPESFAPPRDVVERAVRQGASIVITHDPRRAAEGADCVVTDTWLSMGVRDENRRTVLAPYQVNDELMSLARPDALFMHCLPAHRGDEVTDTVIDGPRSVVWQEAENRLHVQKGILTWCLA